VAITGSTTTTSTSFARTADGEGSEKSDDEAPDDADE
jgi:hypothetical protein